MSFANTVEALTVIGDEDLAGRVDQVWQIFRKRHPGVDDLPSENGHKEDAGIIKKGPYVYRPVIRMLEIEDRGQYCLSRIDGAIFEVLIQNFASIVPKIVLQKAYGEVGGYNGCIPPLSLLHGAVCRLRRRIGDKSVSGAGFHLIKGYNNAGYGLYPPPIAKE